ncbi:hypothetical protein DB30_01651 [Enhygromyxa salina]|uniref:YbbR-like protein n=1 Tax=Enhygromyxa salina TaxID=215803 RepID=A0A0C2DEP6_9BACT|nr:YbbR-like domain-containing protein [Enhygromyxa salina]KIG18147.1 hypothetical protein DB30_01651 [Enhygromyxa salina]
MSDDAQTSWVRRGGTLAIEVATKNWGTKIMAFFLALIVFIVTRDEVTRSFTIPLRVIEDPDRVLLTTPPKTVELQLRGPWVNVNRIAAVELGTATLDLREVSPGPMELDPASIVMPPGVVLDTLEYDHVDLRFEAVIERKLAIVPIVVGEVGPDHRLVGTRVEPDSWIVRAPASDLAGIEQLRTTTLDISGATSSVQTQLVLEAPPVRLNFLGVPTGDLPTVRVVAEVADVIGEIELEVETSEALREALPELAPSVLPGAERVSVRGPRAVLGTLTGLEHALRPTIEVETSSQRGAPISVTVRFEWSPDVPTAAAEQLSIVPPLIRLRLSPQGVELSDPN